MGKVLYKVTLTEEERVSLLKITKRENNQQERLFMR